MEYPRSRILKIYDILNKRYPDPRTLLHFRNPFELLISVILSAQTTDRQVNEVTPGLFEAYPDAASLSRAEQESVENLVRSTGFYRQKAKNIIATARQLEDVHGGAVPAGMDELTRLPGVGRKSANVVLGHIYNRPAVIVDTHFSRVVRRLGLTQAEQPEKIEKEIALLLAPEFHTRFSMVINYHGRDLCLARRPKCGECPLNTLCPWYSEKPAVVLRE
ncbi:endonuclease III [Marispirochaeta aestuarii]|uniref:Endonuclease III n=1 Tax=Marispirochaeta aestuarii TaxID=1963862 RepID=A0A1Y1S011_9SPIO|nr:endonuclease III [Marispirochaeta aestuarii]ORC36481.1 endonuclease III [Marispirochaeta aestuarii]